ncbi:YciY family protein, partial [Salmonella enterica]
MKRSRTEVGRWRMLRQASRHLAEFWMLEPEVAFA